jgi:hypothetical protein
MSSMKISEQQSMRVRWSGTASGRWSRPILEALGMGMQQSQIVLLLITGVVATLPQARSQSMSSSGGTSGSTTAGTVDLTYVRPAERTKVGNYVFDAIGPYPIVGAAIAAGIGQFTNSPPEWKQGAKGFSRRFGSDFAIAAISTTTRYGLAQALKEDTLYYRCECRGFLPRLRHAVISTLTGRQGEDGHRVFSIPQFVAPYAGTTSAVYGWYPSRYGAKDAFRMGNYSLLGEAGENIGLEFFYSGPHSLLSRMHLNDRHGATDPGPNH